MIHEYGDPVPKEQWQAMNTRARDALRAFLTSELWPRLEASDPATWLPIETLGRFDFEGTPVWAVLDFARRTPEGGVEIYDWKTGVVDPEGNRPQLVGYALFVEAAHGVPPERTTTHLVYLGTDIRVIEVRVAASDLEEVRGLMRTSIAAMRARLKEPTRNVAVREDFPLTEDRTKCAVCSFRRPCGR